MFKTMKISNSSSSLTYKDNLTKARSDLDDLQQKVASGENFTGFGDNPLGALKVNNLDNYNHTIEIYKKNISNADYRISTAESKIIAMKDVAVEAKNNILTGVSADDKSLTANSLQAKYDDLINLANTKDENGDYIFSGYAVDKQPFTKASAADKEVQYRGDNGTKKIAIADELAVATNITARDIFVAKNPFGDVLATYNNKTTGHELAFTKMQRNPVVAENFPFNFTDDYSFDFNNRAGLDIVMGKTTALNKFTKKYTLSFKLTNMLDPDNTKDKINSLPPLDIEVPDSIELKNENSLANLAYLALREYYKTNLVDVKAALAQPNIADAAGLFKIDQAVAYGADNKLNIRSLIPDTQLDFTLKVDAGASTEIDFFLTAQDINKKTSVLEVGASQASKDAAGKDVLVQAAKSATIDDPITDLAIKVNQEDIIYNQARDTDDPNLTLTAFDYTYDLAKKTISLLDANQVSPAADNPYSTESYTEGYYINLMPKGNIGALDLAIKLKTNPEMDFTVSISSTAAFADEMDKALQKLAVDNKHIKSARYNKEKHRIELQFIEPKVQPASLDVELKSSLRAYFLVGDDLISDLSSAVSMQTNKTTPIAVPKVIDYACEIIQPPATKTLDLTLSLKKVNFDAKDFLPADFLIIKDVTDQADLENKLLAFDYSKIVACTIGLRDMHYDIATKSFKLEFDEDQDSASNYNFKISTNDPAGSYTINLNQNITTQIGNITGDISTSIVAEANYIKPLPQQNYLKLDFTGNPVAADQVAVTFNAAKTINLLDELEQAVDLFNSSVDLTEPMHKLNYDSLLARFSSNMEHVNLKQVEMGSRTALLESALAVHEDLEVINATGISKLKEVDYARAMTDISQKEMVLKALSSVFAKLSRISLFDYL